MHNFELKFETRKYNSFIFLFLFSFLLPQFSYSSDDPILASTPEQIVADSAFSVFSDRDSVIQKFIANINSNHKSRPVHPYFRDSYRVIRDMRRLVRMFDYRAVNGYESMSDLIDICQKFPERQKTEMIYTAMTGGAVNLISERTNKALRKRKIHCLQWRLEKVYFRSRYKFLRINFHTGMNSKGIVAQIPALRFRYYRYSTSYYSTDGIIVMPLRGVGINCNRINGRINISPFYYSKYGTFALTYDTKYKIVSSRINLKKSSSFVIRIVHINYLDRSRPDRLLSEILLWW